jgi:D-glycero-alpha-D-manno-heptose-7-phosphate kinase
MIISRTPFRISFAGGGSDLSVYYRRECGSVVSTAIDKYIYITVNRKFDDFIRVSYSKTEMVDSVDKVEHNIIRECLKSTGIERGVEIVYMGDMPLGTAGIGLGSSSSLTVGVLNALYAFKGQHMSAESLARQACEIEIEILGQPIGKQDQYAAAYGGFNFFQFNKDETVYSDPIISLNGTKVQLSKRLMLFYTGITRHSSEILTEQKDQTEYNLAYLDKIVSLSRKLREFLLNNDLSHFGDILHQGWLLKTKLASNITNFKINEYYDKAIQAGAIGGKILGAGGGGFLLFYCMEENQDSVRKALSDLKETPFTFEPQGSKIIYVSD